MSWRWLGLLLLFSSLIIGLIVATDLKIFQRVESYAKISETNEEVMDKVVPVPPWNSSKGWVGFNGTLHHRDEVGYEVKGRILLANVSQQPKMVMRVINGTALLPLVFASFDEPTWDRTKIYAAAFLDGDMNKLHDDFKFLDIDNSSKYVFLFRGLKNETRDCPILISLKETWLVGKTLLEPTAPNIFLVAITAVAGLLLLARKPQSSRKPTVRRRSR